MILVDELPPDLDQNSEPRKVVDTMVNDSKPPIRSSECGRPSGTDSAHPELGSASLWFWLLAAPASVVVTLLVLHDVLAVFAIYHVGFCLVLPLLTNVAVHRRSLAGHLRDLGLIGPHTGRGFALGLGLAALCGGGVLLVFGQLDEVLLRNNNVATVLAEWGVGADQRLIVFWFMVLVNGPAEETYWRGFVQTRLADNSRSRRRLWLPSLCYASYHGVTVFMFLSSAAVAALFMACILAAGWLWAWLRLRTQSVWPAVLCHAAASGAYMIVARPLLWP